MVAAAEAQAELEELGGLSSKNSPQKQRPGLAARRRSRMRPAALSQQRQQSEEGEQVSSFMLKASKKA